MVIAWKIRYLDRNDRQWKDRNLYLDTAGLEAVQRAAVELAFETDAQRDFMRFRSLFIEDNSPDGPAKWLSLGCQWFSPIEYFEDEKGIELSRWDIGQILTGSPTAVAVPAGTEQHHLDYMFSENTGPAPIDKITLAPDDIKLLGYFSRDLKELANTAFMKEGGGTFSFQGGEEMVTTAATDEEIRSFVTIFRRLYMANERANFAKAVAVFVEAVSGHRLGKWVSGEAACHEKKSDSEPWFPPLRPSGGYGFANKRLIDVFVYTQYFHQPSPERERQFEFCLKQLNGRKAALAWLFFQAIHQAAHRMFNAGKHIAAWFNRYCEHHRITPDVLASLLDGNPGIGSQEKESDKKIRIFHEKAEQLATAKWHANGRPEGGSAQFLEEAQNELRDAMGG